MMHKKQELKAQKERILKDGKLTLAEANEWYRKGKGQPLTVDAAKVDLDFIDPEDYPEGDGQWHGVQTLFKSKDGKVYGTIDVTRVKGNAFKLSSDLYNFEPHDNAYSRNFFTIVGHVFAGRGTPYYIILKG